MLLVNELGGHTPFTHVTFGLLEGWWLYEDEALRIPGCPGLYPETWKSVLMAEGFHSIQFPAENERLHTQQIITAKSNGVIRQSRKLTPRKSANQTYREHPLIVSSPSNKRERGFRKRQRLF
ncbi:hypothetical protein ACSE3M_01420 [Bacillus velezensis]